MATPRSSLTRNGQVQTPALLTRRFTTTTPPRVGRRTRIVAAMHPSLLTAAHDQDGWFVADFFAFNYLFRGLGQSQTWLATASAESFVARHGEFLHGNPFHDRKVVLSPELIRDGKLTRVTVVQPSAIVDRFLQETKQATEAAKRDGGAVLLLVFCHGVDGEHMALDYTRKTNLSITMLRGVLEPYVSVCLLTTACSSGGWSVCPDLNITTMVAARDKTLSLSWPRSNSIGRYPGSVFVGSVIEALATSTSELFQNQEQDQEQSSSTADNAPKLATHPNLELTTPEQVATYNSFCRSVWDACRGLHRLWCEHTFTFSAQNDEWEEPWTSMAAMSLSDYGARWEALPTYPYRGSPESRAHLDPSPQNPFFQDSEHHVATGQAYGGHDANEDRNPNQDMFIGPLIESMYKNRLATMIDLWRRTCPGDDCRGYGPLLYGFMNRCLEAGTPTAPWEDDTDPEEPFFHYNVVAIIQYRLNMALFAEDLLETMGLFRPGNKSCLMWYEFTWQEKLKREFGLSTRDYDTKHMAVWDVFMRRDPNVIKMITPALEQGPVFHRFIHYIVAAITEELIRNPCRNSDAEADRIRSLGTFVLERITQATAFYEQTALANPQVRERGQAWIKTLRQ